jgi:hypothetical protein
LGRFALVNDATNLMEKSCVKSAVHKPMEATRVKANVAYRARSPLFTRSPRPCMPPAYDTVVVQAAISRATQSDSSPTRII